MCSVATRFYRPEETIDYSAIKCGDSVISACASATDVTRIRVLLFERLSDFVLFTVNVTLGLGSLFQMITVVFRRATVALFFVNRFATEGLVV